MTTSPFPLVHVPLRLVSIADGNAKTLVITNSGKNNHTLCCNILASSQPTKKQMSRSNNEHAMYRNVGFLLYAPLRVSARRQWRTSRLNTTPGRGDKSAWYTALVQQSRTKSTTCPKGTWRCKYQLMCSQSHNRSGRVVETRHSRIRLELRDLRWRPTIPERKSAVNAYSHRTHVLALAPQRRYGGRRLRNCTSHQKFMRRRAHVRNASWYCI